jgi:hypothetical protein
VTSADYRKVFGTIEFGDVDVDILRLKFYTTETGIPLLE